MRKTLFHILSFAMVASVLLAACATPTPQVIIQTAAPVIQTQVVEKAVTQVVEKQVVQTQVVEKQVTQVVEKEVTVAAPTLVPPTPSPTPYAVAKVEAGKVPIYWFVGLGTGTQPSQVAVQEEVVKDFNSAPERATDKIQLIINIIPFNSGRDTLATMIASSNGPDIVGPVGWGGSNAFFGQWLDLTPYIKATKFDTTMFDPALVKMYQTEEGQVGLPFAVYPSAIFYNTALFDEAGLAYPPAKYGEQYKMPDGKMADWNWDTVAQVAKLLTIDSAGKNSTEAGFDKNKIVQYGWTWQWEGNAQYLGAYWKADTLVVPGGSKGLYKSQLPDVWKASWKWFYDGVWGPQPFIPNGQVEAANEFGAGNPFNGGKVAMTDEPSWYLCCLTNLKAWDIGAMPTYNGKVGGRIDADTFRIWKGTKHPKEAFTVLAYLITTGQQKLNVGSKDKPAPYGAFPALPQYQQPFYDSYKAQFPFVKNWETLLKDGLAYPDAPSAEGWMPNWSEAFQRSQTFYQLMRDTGGLDLDKEMAAYQADLDVIFNK